VIADSMYSNARKLRIYNGIQYMLVGAHRDGLKMFSEAGVDLQWRIASEYAAIVIPDIYKSAEANSQFSAKRLNFFRQLMVDADLLDQKSFSGMGILI